MIFVIWFLWKKLPLINADDPKLSFIFGFAPNFKEAWTSELAISSSVPALNPVLSEDEPKTSNNPLFPP